VTHYKLKIASIADLHLLPATGGRVTTEIVGRQLLLGTFELRVFEQWRATLAAAQRPVDFVIN